MDLKALGMLDNPTCTFINCQNILKFLSNSDPRVRASALAAVIQMVNVGLFLT
jgi:hypothetical protein